jgi:prepilin-type N-terminal cleavage/methylation domain-containing protein
MKKKLIQGNKQGFTLMEVIISIAVVLTALVSALALITFSTAGIRLNKSKIIASGLAQEGLELVKNIRDNNWLHNCPACDRRTVGTWRTGLGVGDWRVQYNSGVLLSFSSTPLRIDSSGFYQYDSGSNTSFYRKINIQYISDDQIKVVSEITWSENGRNQIVSAETRYYNWLKE